MQAVPATQTGAALAAAFLLSAPCAFAEQPLSQLYVDQRESSSRWIRAFEELLPAGGSSAPRIFLMVGDIKQSLDAGARQVDGVIMPTNNRLDFKAAYPLTQKDLMSRVAKDSSIEKAINAQLTKYRDHKLTMATEIVPAQLWPTTPPAAPLPFPKYACFIATDEPRGGAGAYRDLFSQRLIAVGVRDCLLYLDSRGAKSVVMPLIGAASAWTVGRPGSDADFEFRQCRMINSIAGIGLGLHQFLPNRKSIEEVGIVQWTVDLERQYPPGTEQSGKESVAEYGSRAVATLDSAIRGKMATPLGGGRGKDCNRIYGFDLDGSPMPLPSK